MAVAAASTDGPTERRVVVFLAWKELHDDLGDNCWAAVTKKVNREHNWTLHRREVQRIVVRCRELGTYKDRTAPRPNSVVLTLVLKLKIIQCSTMTESVVCIEFGGFCDIVA